MSVSDAIKAHRLKKINSSLTYTDLREKRAAQAARVVKMSKINGTLTGDGISSSDTLRRLFYQMKEDYTGKPSFAVEEDSEKSKKLWDRVAKACEESGVCEEDYMKAQFNYFHKSFGKAPTYSQLSTVAAVMRAREFLPTERKVVANAREVTVDFASLMRSAEINMQRLMAAQSMTREEVYRNLVVTGLYSFPKEYMEADPVYKKIKEGK